MPKEIPMMAITIISSINVKPFWVCAFIVYLRKSCLFDGLVKSGWALLLLMLCLPPVLQVLCQVSSKFFDLGISA